ncbi:MAG TPA: MDR family MFS transporter, partial [Ktedonobacteraceae bacterium]|nr:MDR family MFS transporter [Ktedonobacteraceae bacterium]
MTNNASSSADVTNRIVENDERPRYSRRETLLTMLGVLLVLLLASLDQTIVSTAMPRIVADLQGFDRYTWVTTAYMLTSTVTVPIYGKLSDILGRKSVYIVGLSLFLVGSALSGAAPSMNMLIAFRAFQGLGAGALIPISIAIIGDLFTPRERARWQGVTGAVFGLSSIVGPLVGGWLTQYASWRWIFYVNLPLGIIALLTAIFLMPVLRNAAGRGSIDYIGDALLIIGTVPLLLGFTWAGTLYRWLSPQIIGLLVFAVFALTAFVLYEAYLERHGGQPIIEPGLFKNSIFTISVIVTTIFGMGLFGSIFFIPLFVQGVLGTSVGASGFILTPLMLTSVVASILSGQLVSRLGRYKWIAITGMAITLAGGLLLLRLDLQSTTSDVIIAMLVMGFG